MPFTPRILACLVSSLLLSACGGGDSDSAPQEPPVQVLPPEPLGASLIIDTRPPFELPADAAPVASKCESESAEVELAFSEVTDAAGLCYPTGISPEDSTAARVGGGVAVYDYDGDGGLDVFVSSGRDSNGRLFRYAGNGSFEDVTEKAGIALNSTDLSAAFVDVTDDGLVDLVTVQDGPSYIQVFAGKANGTFEEVTDGSVLTKSKPAFSIAAGDYDLDGDLDLYFAHWSPFEKQTQTEFLWHNQGGGVYSDYSDIADIGTFKQPVGGELVTEKSEYSFTPLFADINNDLYPDLLVASDFGFSQVLLNNNGTGLVDVTPNAVNDRAGMGASVADYDNDGDLDWFVSAIGDRREEFLTIGLLNGSRLYQNDGEGNFSNVTDEAGVRQGYWGWGACFADFNNDGWQDLFAVNGFDGMTEEQAQDEVYALYHDDPAVFFVNNGDGTFTEQAAKLGIDHTAMGRGLACYDYDRDGDIDMLIANSGQPPSLYRNNTFAEGQNFINIRLQGTEQNPHAVGAKIYLTVNGQEQLQQLLLGSGYLAQNPIEAHFGLGTAEVVERIRIVWPGTTGKQDILEDVTANQFITIKPSDN